LKTWGTCWEHSGNIEGKKFKDTLIALLKWELGIWIIPKFKSRRTRKVTLCFKDFVLLSSSHQYHSTSVRVFISWNFKFLNLWYHRYLFEKQIYNWTWHEIVLEEHTHIIVQLQGYINMWFNYMITNVFMWKATKKDAQAYKPHNQPLQCFHLGCPSNFLI
jgi:hypothetical protein